MYWLPPFFYMEEKFWSLEKRVKTIAIIRDEIFQKNCRVQFFLLQNDRRNFWRVENRKSWRETEKMQIKLTATCDKNEQQDVKNISEL